MTDVVEINRIEQLRPYHLAWAALHAETEHHVERLARLFWFTVEFGLIEERGQTKLYGSGLISSLGESEFSLNSPHVDRRPFDMDLVCDTPFEIDHYQPILYVLESFEQLRDAMVEYAERVLNESGTGAEARVCPGDVAGPWVCGSALLLWA